MAETVPIEEVMRRSGVGFGTSGARGLVTAMTDEVCSAYAEAFLAWLRTRGDIGPATDVALAGDRRDSTARILEAVAAGVQRAGHRALYFGRIPTPALALQGITAGIPSMMVTGSHIPDDRNGIKFYAPRGEILKADEAAIRATEVELRPGRASLPAADPAAAAAYRRRFSAAYGPDALAGLRVGVYGHSAAGRELLVDVITDLGGIVTRLDFTDTFEAVDTEAIRPADIERARRWATEYAFDAVVSTDGDSDRPLVADETGAWIRGDVAGILVAKNVGADAVVTPISSNTAVERCAAFNAVVRTRIGSPYVIEAMMARSEATVVGYEANGGFLTATPAAGMSALPTRDAFIVIVSLLQSRAASDRRLSEIVADLPRRFTASVRLRDIAPEQSLPHLDRLRTCSREAIADELDLSPVVDINLTDGVRLTLSDDTIVHLRASGNAPELRCYAEADDPQRAAALAEATLRRAEAWR